MEMVSVETGEKQRIRVYQVFLEEPGGEEYRIAVRCWINGKRVDLALGNIDEGSWTEPVGNEVDMMRSLPRYHEKDMVKLHPVGLLEVDGQTVLPGKEVCQPQHLKFSPPPSFFEEIYLRNFSGVHE